MTNSLAPTGERKSATVSDVLLLQAGLATLLGAWGGWLRLPYDGAVLLLALGAFIALAVFAVVRATKCARSMPGLSRWAPMIIVLAMQPISYAAIITAQRTFDSLGNEWRFERDRARYERIVREVRARSWQPGLHQTVIGGTGVQISVSDAVRIELSWTGFFSNWEAVIHDPTHAVGLVETPTRNLGQEALRHAFGDFRLGYCEKLSGAYYSCQFG